MEPSARTEPVLAYDAYTDSIYLLGGQINTVQNVMFHDLWQYHISDGQWTRLAEHPECEEEVGRNLSFPCNRLIAGNSPAVSVVSSDSSSPVRILYTDLHHYPLDPRKEGIHDALSFYLLEIGRDSVSAQSSISHRSRLMSPLMRMAHSPTTTSTVWAHDSTPARTGTTSTPSSVQSRLLRHQAHSSLSTTCA